MKRYKKPLLIGGTMLAIFAILGAVLPTSGANILSRVLIMMLFGTAVNVMFGHSGLIAFGQGFSLAVQRMRMCFWLFVRV